MNITKIKQKGDELYFKFYDEVRKRSAQKTRIKQFKRLSSVNVLTEEQKQAVREFYAPYKVPNLIFHAFFTEKTGEFHANYIPQDLYVGYIDPYLNDLNEAKYIDNKCYFGALFNTIPQPYSVLKRINNFWFDHDGNPIDFEAALNIIEKENEGVFIKEARDSSGGHGVVFVASDAEAKTRAREVINAIHTDIVIQRPLHQHKELAAINSSSVNTMRLYSVLKKDGSVKIYSGVLRIGVGNIKVDNYASGGLSCGITSDGKLRKLAFNKKGQKFEKHPVSNVVFDGFQIPSYEKAVELVQKAHRMMPHFRSVSWDVSIQEDGNPVLIEGNLCRGGIDLLQLSNGPLFGEDTKEILDEVFAKK